VTSSDQLLFDFYMSSELAAEEYCNEIVDGRGRLLYVDRGVSVSGLRRDATPAACLELKLRSRRDRFLKLFYTRR